MKKAYLCFFFSFILLTQVSCSFNALFGNNTMPEKGIVRLSPSSLFEGDAKKLEPHLDMLTCCVKVKYKGSKDYLNVFYEIWEKGELISTPNILGSSIVNGYDGEISFSMKNISTDITKPVYKQIIAMNNGSTTSINKEIAFPDYAHGSISIPETIDVTDEKETAIWGYIAKKDGSFRQENTIEETAKKADWALILKLSFSEIKPRGAKG